MSTNDASRVRDELAAQAKPAEAATQDGPLGGFAPVGPAAVQLDFMLTQFQTELQTAMDDATSVEDSCYHDAEALKLKREIIDRFASSDPAYAKLLAELQLIREAVDDGLDRSWRRGAVHAVDICITAARAILLGSKP